MIDTQIYACYGSVYARCQHKHTCSRLQLVKLCIVLLPFPVFFSDLLDAKRCKTIADVAFLVDSSSSMRRDYKKQMKIVEYIAKQFGIAPRQSNAAVILFGRYAKIEIPLGSYQTMDTFKAALNNVPFIGGYGRLDEGLYAAQSLLLGEDSQ